MIAKVSIYNSQFARIVPACMTSTLDNFSTSLMLANIGGGGILNSARLENAGRMHNPLDFSLLKSDGRNAPSDV